MIVVTNYFFVKAPWRIYHCILCICIRICNIEAEISMIQSQIDFDNTTVTYFVRFLLGNCIKLTRYQSAVMFEGVSRYIVKKAQLTFKTTHLDHFKTHEWRIYTLV